MFIKLTEIHVTYEDDQRCVQRMACYIRPSFIRAIRFGGDCTLLDLDSTTLTVKETVEEVLALINNSEQTSYTKEC